MNQKSYLFFSGLVLASLAIVSSGCSSTSDRAVETFVEGKLSVRAEIDSTADYSGFRISVLSRTEGDIDTLATAITSTDGLFEFTVEADDEGVYPIVVERAGVNLSLDEIVIVNGDSIQVTGVFPLGPRGLRIISLENAAWASYRNAKASHNTQMLALLQSQNYTTSDIGRVNTQTATILWSIPATYPGTIGGNLSMAESVVMMEGWNDAIVIARYPEVSPDNQSIVDVLRAARRSVARIAGQDSAMALLDRYMTLIPDEKRAELMAEKIVAYADSMNTPEAVRVATELKKTYPDSEWAKWAERATYELENLQPGMNAPSYTLISRDGEAVTTTTMTGKFVILEFYDPSEQIFQRELERRDGITEALDDRLFETISISVEPDSVVNEALFDGITHPGMFVWLSEGMEAKVIKDFNIQILPTRYLLDPGGLILAKYSGPALATLEEDLASIMVGINGLTDVSVRPRNP